MARIARVVLPGLAHHVTQRGNHQQTVFFSDHDRWVYLQALRDNCAQYEVTLIGYCLMSNHVHLLAVPKGEDSLGKALGRTHIDYARWQHVQQRQTGHLWQNRFFSCPLEEAHLWEALRYVELNPVRAGVVATAWEWPWSSAQAHVLRQDPSRMLDLRMWQSSYTAKEWREALELGIREAEMMVRIREATRTGRPLGSAGFIESLEQQMGRALRPQKRGPKCKVATAGGQLNLGVS